MQGCRLGCKRILVVLLTLVLAVSAGVTASAEDGQEVYSDTVRDVDPSGLDSVSGTCGDNLVWTLDGSALSITGSGAMTNYTENNLPPWYNQRDRIETVTIGSGVSTLGNMSFYQCSGIQSVTLPDSVVSIGDLAFAQCSALVNITLSDNLTSIGTSAFELCEALALIRLPDGLTTIGQRAFQRCRALTGVVLPASATDLGSMCFAFCTGLCSARILGQITVLPDRMFYGCTNLSKVYLPSSLSSLGERPLSGCTSLSYVDYGGSQAVKDEIDEILSSTEEVYTGVITSSDYVQTESADIAVNSSTYEYTNSDGSLIPDTMEISASITGDEGWDDLAEVVSNSQYRSVAPTVNVYAENTVLSEGVLSAFSGESGTLVVHSGQNAYWSVNLEDQDDAVLDSAQDFTVSLVKNESVSKAWAKIIGDAESFTVTIGKTSLNATVYIPVGSENAFRTATLYQISGSNLTLIGSTVVDMDGCAAFSLAGTDGGNYLLALDVEGITLAETTIPDKLLDAYGADATLTDAEGNQYIINGRTSSLPFSLGQLMIGAVVGMVALGLLVGIIMVLYNRSKKRQAAEARRLEEEEIDRKAREELAQEERSKKQ